MEKIYIISKKYEKLKDRVMPVNTRWERREPNHLGVAVVWRVSRLQGPFGVKHEKTADVTTVSWVRQYLSVSATSTASVKLHVCSPKQMIHDSKFAFFMELKKCFSDQKEHMIICLLQCDEFDQFWSVWSIIPHFLKTASRSRNN